jgi:hypothetical protein
MKKLIKAIILRIREIISGRQIEIEQPKLTLDQVKADIKAGKCKKIFYSETTLWWTHDPADLEDSTAMGKAFCLARHKAEMRNPNIKDNERARLKGLFWSFYKGKTPPLDPIGQVLYETDNLTKWIRGAEESPQVFGRHGLDAFMRMHHQNCQGKIFASWDEVNCDIDGLPLSTEVKAQIQAPVVSITPGRNERCPCNSGKKYKHCHALLNN